jgi:hypothetical protein
MGLMNRVRKRHIRLMSKTLDTLGNVLKYVTPAQATGPTDGPEGWSVLEVLCHLRDFDEIFHQRAAMIVEQTYPLLTAYDQDAIAVERDYKAQNITQVYVDLVKSRRAFIEFFEALEDHQWDRAGVHPEYGHWSLTDCVMQVGLHDNDHIEQITRILATAQPSAQPDPAAHQAEPGGAVL